MNGPQSISISSTSTLRMNIHITPSLETPSNANNLATAATPTVYFGYGSNLWKAQMRLRCPTSRYLGIARLRGYKWIIYDRGYANIVKLDGEDDDDAKSAVSSSLLASGKDGKDDGEDVDFSREVWGLVYSLEADDERRLDGNEGVPVAYQKAWIECEFWAAGPGKHGDDDDDCSDGNGRSSASSSASSLSSPPDTTLPPVNKSMLVYINHTLQKESTPKKEYIYRMNQGIRDALREGMPAGYVRQVMRRFIPEEDPEAVAEVAGRQAVAFHDEK